MKLLIVEDEKELQTIVCDFYLKAGNQILASETCFDAQDKLIDNQFDLIILDITLPDGNGIDLVPIIKKTQKNAGILILSAKNSLDDKIKGLDIGADDYLTKPFHLSELNSRINAIIRRKSGQTENSIHFNEIKINLDENQVYIHDKVLSLTKKEFSLLLHLVTNKNRILTKESIAEHLWGENDDFFDNFDFIYTHIKNMRKKIQQEGGTDYLKTVHGIGYKFSDV